MVKILPAPCHIPHGANLLSDYFNMARKLLHQTLRRINRDCIMHATLVGQPLVLKPGTVDMAMSDNPVSVSQNETAQGVAQLLISRRISAAPVIDEAGRPVGVISRTDLVSSLMQPHSHIRTLAED